MEIIAEIGSNFETFEDCIAAIGEASAAGATAVKFQYFSERDLYGTGSTDTKLKKEWLPGIREAATADDVKLGITAFSQDGLDTVGPFVDFYKVASAENAMVFNFDRDIPILISTGGATLAEIDDIVENNNLGPNVCLLYCVPAYPAEVEEYSIGSLLTLFARYSHIQIGISDHTNDTALASIISTLDLSWIEKHFRPKNTSVKSPDFKHAIPAKTFNRMVGIYNADSEYFIRSSSDELFRKLHRRQLIDINGVKQFVRPR